MRRLFLLFFCIIIGFPVLATHIVGGEITYECLGNDEYLITLKVYRDCLNGQAPFDPEAAVTTYDANNNLVRNDMLKYVGPFKVNYSAIEPCYKYNSNICVEEAIYQGKFLLPKTPGGYTIAYQRCCRNKSIINLSNPEDNGATYMVHISDEALNLCNSSPVFEHYPPMAVCAGKPTSIKYSATDRDGDSLVYEFITPFHGGGTQQGGLSGNPNGPNTPMPNPAAPPPYSKVTWRAGFSTNYQVDANPPFSINSRTGIITGVPTTMGQYVFGVAVKEYRKGVFLSEIYRDFQFQTVICEKSTIAQMQPQIEKCDGYKVSFLNQTQGNAPYKWNFGDPTTNADTANSYNTSYTYPDSGKYKVTLIAWPGYSCADTTTEVFDIHQTLAPDFEAPEIQCLIGNSFNFEAGGKYSPTAKFHWDFGTSASQDSSQLENPSQISFSDTGAFNVTLTINENDCEESVTKKVKVYPHPIPKFSVEGLIKCAPYRLNITDESYAKTSLNYIWDFGNGDTSYSATPFYIYNDSGSYNISLTVFTDEGCIDTTKTDLPTIINVYPTPKANFELSPYTTSIFESEITFTNLANPNHTCYLLTGDGKRLASCDTSYAYQDVGVYRTKQAVINSFGCVDTAYLDLEITGEFAFFAPNAFTPNGDGNNDFFKPIIYGIESYTLQIFDRWGKIVFETDSRSKGWDGSISSSMLAQQDNYTYRVEAVDYLGNNRLFIGSVLLIR